MDKNSYELAESLDTDYLFSYNYFGESDSFISYESNKDIINPFIGLITPFIKEYISYEGYFGFISMKYLPSKMVIGYDNPNSHTSKYYFEYEVDSNNRPTSIKIFYDEVNVNSIPYQTYIISYRN